MYPFKSYEDPAKISKNLKNIYDSNDQEQQIIAKCSIRNMKQLYKIHCLDATKISYYLQQDLEQRFGDHVQVLKLEFRITDEQLEVINQPEFNNIMDCDFLMETIQLSQLSLEDQSNRYGNNYIAKQNRFSKENIINNILIQIQKPIYEFNKEILQKIILDYDPDLNLEKETVAIASLIFNLKFLTILANYKFLIKKVPLYLNFSLTKINQEENDLLVLEYNRKKNKKLLCIRNFSFGILHENNEDCCQNVDLETQQLGINYIFSNYYEYRSQWQLQFQGSPKLYYDYSNTRSSKYFEIVEHVDQNILIRIKVNLSYFQFAFHKNTQIENIIYLKLISPPAFQISIVNKRKQEIYNLKKDWIRIQNIFLDSGVKQKKISELQRLMLINNTSIKLEFNNSLFRYDMLTFQGLLNNLNLFQLMHNNKFHEFQIKIEDGINNHFLQFSRIQYEMKLLPFSCQFNIYSVVSTNRLFIPLYLSKLVRTLVNKQQELDQLNFDKIQEATFQQFYKMSENCNLYYHLVIIHDSQLQMFNKIWNKIENEIIQGEVSIDTAYIYRLNLTPSGFTYQFRMPEETSKVLRDYYNHRDCFIRLQIQNDNSEPLQNTPFLNKNYFRDLLVNGVQIFNRRYSLLTWSASQLRSGSCWLFDSVTSNISRTQIIESVGNFQDKLSLGDVAKNAARLGQQFSASSSFQFKSPVNVEVIEDKFDPSGKAYTDGIGGISEDLIEEIRKYHNRPFESALQIRYHGAKGVLALNKNLPNRTIHLRKSMIKFDPSLQQNSTYGQELSIIEYNKFRGGYLNRQLIILLSTLGVPDEVFIELQDEYICTIIASNSSIYKLLDVDFQESIQDIVDVQRKMMNAGLTDQNNLFLKHSYDRLKERGLQHLRRNCNILVEKAARLLGVIDEYDLLNEDEVFAIYAPSTDDKPRIVTSKTGYVIVSRNPCLHPGDIRKLAIVSDEEIKRRNQGKNPYFPDMVNCVIFPTQGLAITVQCGGGDLDGDQYFISWDDRMMIEKHCEPMVYDEDTKKKQKKVEERAEFTEEYFQTDRMLDFLFQYLDSDVLGKIDNSHLAIADKSPYKANDEKCKQLAILHAKAVDYVKHGERVTVPQDLVAKEWPDFMELDNKLFQYQSKNILGQLYDTVKALTNYLTISEKALIVGYKNPNLLDIDIRFIYKYNLISEKYKNESSYQPFIMEEDRSEIPENSESAFQDNILVYEEEILDFIENTFPEYMIKLALQCLILIFQLIDSLKRMYGVKSEYEIYTGYYTNFTKGEGTRQKQKLNIENIQVLQHLIKLKRRIDQQIGFCKTQRLAIISLMHFILSYSPSSHQMNTQNFKGQFIYFLIKQIEKKEEEQFQRLQDNFSTWYRGCTWFLYADELLQIKDDIDEFRDIEEI